MIRAVVHQSILIARRVPEITVGYVVQEPNQSCQHSIWNHNTGTFFRVLVFSSMEWVRDEVKTSKLLVSSADVGNLLKFPSVAKNRHRDCGYSQMGKEMSVARGEVQSRA
jgi:hypothetical protein